MSDRQPLTGRDTAPGTGTANGRSWGYAGALLGGLVSIAANVAHSYVPSAEAPADWRPALGAVVGAVFWPVALFVAVEILARTEWPRAKRWVFVRSLGLLPVAAVAALVSYFHLSGLLSHYGESRLIAHLGPLAVDGLMVMASASLMATAPGRTSDTPAVAARPADSAEADENPDTIADIRPDAAPEALPARARTPSTRRQQTTAAKVAALAAKHPDMTSGEMAKRIGVTDRTIRRHLNAPAPGAAAEPMSAEMAAPAISSAAA